MILSHFTKVFHIRFFHAVALGERVDFHEKFVLPDGTEMAQPHADGAPAHQVINCRCTVISHVKNPMWGKEDGEDKRLTYTNPSLKQLTERNKNAKIAS